MPPWAAPRMNCPLLLRIASAPIRPLIAPNACPPGLRSPWTIGLGPIPLQFETKVAGPEVGVPFFLSWSAALAAAARALPASCSFSGLSPAVRRVMNAMSRCWRISSVASSKVGIRAPGRRIGSSPVLGGVGPCALAGTMRMLERTRVIATASAPARITRGSR